jgi:hypothetical protein
MTDPTATGAGGPDSTDPTQIDPADAELLAQLRHAVQVSDPVPASMVDAAKGLLTWRTIDAELAELQFDSALDASGVRGLAWPRQLSFEAREISIEIEVDHDRLVGQVVPPAEIELTLTDTEGAIRSTRSDHVGHFRFTEVESGTVRVTAARPDGSVTTQWFTIQAPS